MTLTIELPPAAEAQLHALAAREGKDAAAVAAGLLEQVLERRSREWVEAVEGIRRGLEDGAAGGVTPLNNPARRVRPSESSSKL